MRRSSAAHHPSSLIEIRVVAGGDVDVSERYSEDVTDRLLEALRRRGIDLAERFRTPCG